MTTPNATIADDIHSGGHGSQTRASPRVRFPIRAKITLPYLLLAILLAVGAALLVTRIVFDTLDERFTNQLIESGKLGSEWMVREESRLLETLRLLAYGEGIPQAVQTGDADQLRELAFGMTVDHGEDSVLFLDKQGNLILSMHHPPGAPVEDYQFTTGGDPIYKGWSFVQSVLKNQVDTLGDKYSGYAQTPKGQFFYVAGPLFGDRHEFAGVVLVGKSLERMVGQVRAETLSQVTYYSFDGTPLASTFHPPQPLPQDQLALVLNQQDSGSLRRNLKPRRELTVNNIDYDELLGPWEVRGDVDLGVIGSSLPKTFLVSTTRVTRIQITVLVALTFALIILTGLMLSRYITSPLIGLVKASTQVAGGDLEVHLDNNSNDEVAILAESFNQMVASLQASKMELVNAYDRTLEGWSKAAELRDKETEDHMQRVTDMTVRLAKKLGIQGEQLEAMRRGAVLHDIGKVGVSDNILLKPGRLTEEEMDAMRMHPVYAYEMLWPIEYLRPAIDIPYCHHERWDGKGYPRGLKGEETPLAARIFAMVDVWDALRSDRVYRKALPEEEVLRILREGSGTQFDPSILQLFLSLLEECRAA